MILSGKPNDVYEPRFTYHGFRYVQIDGLTEKPTLDSLVGRWVSTDPESPARSPARTSSSIKRKRWSCARSSTTGRAFRPTARSTA